MKDGSVYTNKAEFHKRQGNIDGACAVYCLMMCLLHLNYIDDEDLDIYNFPNRKTAKGKLLYELLENKGLIKGGYSYATLKKDIENACGKDLIVSRFAPRTQERIVDKIGELIDEDIPPIISIVWEDGAHALLSIGIEMDNKDKITKILCLDPSSEKPQVSYWNCYIDVSKLKGDNPIKCVSINESPFKCKLGDLLIIEKL